MFIGHYAAGLALKSVEKKVSLGLLFIAVQFVDILFFAFVPFGIEKFRLVENYTAINHFELYFYPYTHGLLSSFLWAGLVYVLWNRVTGKIRIAMILTLGVLSHWFADLIVHTPDLPLLGDDSLKVGFGLWNSFMGTIIVEVGLTIGALILYLRSTKPVGNMGKYAMIAFVSFMIAFYIMAVNMPFDPTLTVEMASIMSLIIFTIFTAIAFWLDRYRT